MTLGQLVEYNRTNIPRSTGVASPAHERMAQRLAGFFSHPQWEAAPPFPELSEREMLALAVTLTLALALALVLTPSQAALARLRQPHPTRRRSPSRRHRC